MRGTIRGAFRVATSSFGGALQVFGVLPFVRFSVVPSRVSGSGLSAYCRGPSFGEGSRVSLVSSPP